MPIELIARFECREDSQQTVRDLIRDYAITAREDPGTLRFEAYVEQDSPCRFVVVERYADDSSFAAHLGHPANAAFNRQLAPHIVDPASHLTLLTRVG